MKLFVLNIIDVLKELFSPSDWTKDTIVSHFMFDIIYHGSKHYRLLQIKQMNQISEHLQFFGSFMNPATSHSQYLASILRE